MSVALEELLQAALAASPDSRRDALQILLGQAQIAVPGTPTSSPEPYLSLRDVSRLTGISTTSLWRYRIPGHRFGGRLRYRLSEVEEYLRTEEFQRRVAALRAERKVQLPTANGRNVE